MAKQQRKSKKHFQIEKTKKNVFLIVIVASMVLSVSLVLGKFIFDWSQFNARVWSAQSEAIDTLNSNIANAEQVINEYQAFEGTSDIKPEQILDALPANYDLSAWNSSLQFIAGLNSLDLESITGDDLSLDTEAKSNEPSPQEFTFGLEANGDYKKVQSFVGDFNRSIRPIALDQLTLSGSPDNITVEVNGRTFYQPAQSLDFSSEEIR